MKQQIYSIEGLKVSLIKTNPPILLLRVSGLTLTSGWKNGQLILKSSRADIINGLWKFDFVADPPTGIYLNVLSPIEAIYEFTHVPEKKIQILVSGTSNSKDMYHGKEENPVLPKKGLIDSNEEIRYSIGYSNSFSFDEAFRNAVQNLHQGENSADKLENIAVEKIGAHIGGIAGIQQLFIKISAQE
jgi:hypothetical protein